MKPFFIFATVLFLCPSVQGESLVTPKPFFRPQDGDTVVFLGDSITHQAFYTQYLENYFFTRFPERRIKFHNAGVGGDKAADALARFSDDVAALNPDFVTILLGMNDGQYEPFSTETLEAYQSGVIQILENIEELGAEAITLSPTMFDHHQFGLRQTDETFRFRDRPFDSNYNSLLAFYSSWLRQTASTRQSPFVNLWGPLNDLTFAMRRTQPDFSVIEDAIHPGAAGHFLMAYLIVEASVPERRSVSSIVIAKRQDEWTAGRNSQVSNLSVSETADSVSFTFLARSLPWVAPETASNEELRWGPSAPPTLGYELAKAGHRLSRELLRIDGLHPGTYELMIDDVVIGRFTDLQLGSKVELQNYRETPQSQQALRVAHLNRARNDEVIRPMRELWSKVKGLRRKELSETDFAGRYSALKSEIGLLHAEAEQFEERIYEAAQPVPRRYRLVRIDEP